VRGLKRTHLNKCQARNSGERKPRGMKEHRGPDKRALVSRERVLRTHRRPGSNGVPAKGMEERRQRSSRFKSIPTNQPRPPTPGEGEAVKRGAQEKKKTTVNGKSFEKKTEQKRSFNTARTKNGRLGGMKETKKRGKIKKTKKEREIRE